jgi:hypothetical protein
VWQENNLTKNSVAVNHFFQIFSDAPLVAYIIVDQDDFYPFRRVGLLGNGPGVAYPVRTGAVFALECLDARGLFV